MKRMPTPLEKSGELSSSCTLTPFSPVLPVLPPFSPGRARMTCFISRRMRVTLTVPGMRPERVMRSLMWRYSLSMGQGSKKGTDTLSRSLSLTAS
jgi:hypothetical protein